MQRVHDAEFQPEGIADAAVQRANPGQFVFNRWRCERVIGDLRRHPDQTHASTKSRREIILANARGSVTNFACSRARRKMETPKQLVIAACTPAESAIVNSTMRERSGIEGAASASHMSKLPLPHGLTQDCFQLSGIGLARITEIDLVMIASLDQPVRWQELLVEFFDDWTFLVVRADMHGLNRLPLLD